MSIAPSIEKDGRAWIDAAAIKIETLTAERDALKAEIYRLKACLCHLSTPMPVFDINKIADRPDDEVVFVAVKCGTLNQIRAALTP